MGKQKYIGFKVKFIPEDEEQDTVLNIGEEDSNAIPGLIYWRSDVILGFNSGEEEDSCYLIVGMNDLGNRMQFKVDEPLKDVLIKLENSD